MSPESVLRSILQAEETFAAAVIKAHVEKAAALRQLLEKMVRPAEAPAPAPEALQ